MTENNQLNDEILALIAYINKTPALLSLLYDLNLLPEQTLDNTCLLNKMLIITKAWEQREIGFQEALVLEINRNFDKAKAAIDKTRSESINGRPELIFKHEAISAIEGLKDE